MYSQVILVIREQVLRRLGPQRRERVLALPPVVPLDVGHQLQLPFLALRAALLDDAHHRADLVLPAAFRQHHLLLVGVAVGFALAALFATRGWRGGVDVGGGALEVILCFGGAGLLGWAADGDVVFF